MAATAATASALRQAVAGCGTCTRRGRGGARACACARCSARCLACAQPGAVPTHAQGNRLVGDSAKGVESREAALLMRSHKFQSLGDACLTDGVDPGVKYKSPVLNSHDYGWRCATKSNGRPNLEMFGVAEHGRKAVSDDGCAPPACRLGCCARALPILDVSPPDARTSDALPVAAGRQEIQLGDAERCGGCSGAPIAESHCSTLWCVALRFHGGSRRCTALH